MRTGESRVAGWFVVLETLLVDIHTRKSSEGSI